MKILKIILFIVLGLVVIGAILVFTAPTTVKVEESKVIDAPKPLVFKHIRYLEKQHAWNPWNELDPGQQVTFSGDEDGTPGYKYEWVGEVNGKGYQQLVSLDENSVEQDLVFIEPWESKSKVFFTVEEVEEGTKVTWAMDAEMPAPMNAVMLFTDMGMSSDFQKGLNNLEDIEKKKKNNPEYRGYAINQVEIEPVRFLGVREVVSMDEMQDFYGNSYGELAKKLGAFELTRPSGIYYSWEVENNRTDMMAAMAAPENAPAMLFDDIRLSGKALQVEVVGSYDQLEDAHWALDEYIQDFGVTMKFPVWEEYVTDPMSEKDTSKWLTKVTYFIE